MRATFMLGILVLGVAVLQTAILPEILPKAWRPDLGLAVGLAALAFLKRETALVFLFALGLQADLLASERLGLLTCCYLASAWVLLAYEYELVRGGAWAAWLGVIAGTAVAHGLYALLGQLAGIEMGWWEGLQRAGASALLMAALGGPLVVGLQVVLARLELLSPEAREIRARRPRRRGWLRA